MKKFLLMFIAIFSLSSAVYAEEGMSNLHVIFNSRELTMGMQTVNVVFTNKPFASEPDFAADNAISNFLEYDNLQEADKVNNLVLDIHTDAKGVYGSNKPKSLYVSFQIFSGIPINVVISQNGPLCLTPDEAARRLNWRVFEAGKENVYAETGNPDAVSFVIYKSDTTHFGMCGSRELSIMTEQLDQNDVGSYKASIIAKIETVV